MKPKPTFRLVWIPRLLIAIALYLFAREWSISYGNYHRWYFAWPNESGHHVLAIGVGDGIIEVLDYPIYSLPDYQLISPVSLWRGVQPFLYVENYAFGSPRERLPLDLDRWQLATGVSIDYYRGIGPGYQLEGHRYSVAFWVPAIALSPLLYWLIRSLIRERRIKRRNRAGLCPDCGYDLRGNTLSKRCPECGIALTPACAK